MSGRLTHRASCSPSCFIESPEGVANIEEIIAVPGLGGIFIGPSDLSTSMGHASPAAPEVEAAIQTVLAACLGHDVPCAIITRIVKFDANNGPYRISSGCEGVAADTDGIIYSAEVGPRPVKRYVRFED